MVDYSVAKSRALKLILILGAITIFEVFVALLGKGYIIEGTTFPAWLMGLFMVGMSAFKAAAIVMEFMHMQYEVKAFRLSVVLPMLLLVWAIIAFIWEGSYTLNSRNKIKTVRESVPMTFVVAEDTAKVSKDTAQVPPIDTAEMKKDHK